MWEKDGYFRGYADKKGESLHQHLMDSQSQTPAIHRVRQGVDWIGDEKVVNLTTPVYYEFKILRH